MSELSPELRRLLKLSQKAADAAPHSMTQGFDKRVVTHWLSAGALLDPISYVQDLVWKLALPAAAIVALGLTLLASRTQRNAATYDFGPALQVVSTKLVP